MKKVTTAYVKQLFAQNANIPLLTLLTLTNDTDTVRLINDMKGVTYESDSYLAFPFAVTMAAENDDESPTITIKADNVSRVIAEKLRASAEPMKASIEIVSVDDGFPTSEMGPIHLKVMTSQITETTVTLKLGHMYNVLNGPSIKDIFNAGTAPGLFV